MPNPNLNIMRAAIETAEANKTPFAAALAMGDEVFVTAFHQPGETGSTEAHAENLAIKILREHLQKTDLSGFTLYSTCEPCDFCMNKALRANISTIFFGCAFSEVLDFYPQIKSSKYINQKSSFKEIDFVGDVCIKQCRKLLIKYS